MAEGGRRLSILKTNKSPNRPVLQDLMDINCQEEKEDTLKCKRLSRRVSFAEKYQVKEYDSNSVCLGLINTTELMPITGSDESSVSDNSSTKSQLRGLDSLLGGKISKQTLESVDNACIQEIPVFCLKRNSAVLTESENEVPPKMFCAPTEHSPSDFSQQLPDADINAERYKFGKEAFSLAKEHVTKRGNPLFSSSDFLQGFLTRGEAKISQPWNEEKENMCMSHQDEEGDSMLECSARNTMPKLKMNRRQTILFDKNDKEAIIDFTECLSTAIELNIPSGAILSSTENESNAVFENKVGGSEVPNKRRTILFDENDRDAIIEVTECLTAAIELNVPAEDILDNENIALKKDRESEKTSKRRTILFENRGEQMELIQDETTIGVGNRNRTVVSAEDMDLTETYDKTIDLVQDRRTILFENGGEEMELTNDVMIDFDKNRRQTIIFDGAGENMELTEVAEPKLQTLFLEYDREVIQKETAVTPNRTQTLVFDNGESMELSKELSVTNVKFGSIGLKEVEIDSEAKEIMRNNESFDPDTLSCKEIVSQDGEIVKLIADLTAGIVINESKVLLESETSRLWSVLHTPKSNNSNNVGSPSLTFDNTGQLTYESTAVLLRDAAQTLESNQKEENDEFFLSNYNETHTVHTDEETKDDCAKQTLPKEKPIGNNFQPNLHPVMTNIQDHFTVEAFFGKKKEKERNQTETSETFRSRKSDKTEIAHIDIDDILGNIMSSCRKSENKDNVFCVMQASSVVAKKESSMSRTLTLLPRQTRKIEKCEEGKKDETDLSTKSFLFASEYPITDNKSQTFTVLPKQISINDDSEENRHEKAEMKTERSFENTSSDQIDKHQTYTLVPRQFAKKDSDKDIIKIATESSTNKRQTYTLSKPIAKEDLEEKLVKAENPSGFESEDLITDEMALLYKSPTYSADVDDSLLQFALKPRIKVRKGLKDFLLPENPRQFSFNHKKAIEVPPLHPSSLPKPQVKPMVTPWHHETSSVLAKTSIRRMGNVVKSIPNKETQCTPLLGSCLNPYAELGSQSVKQTLKFDNEIDGDLVALRELKSEVDSLKDTKSKMDESVEELDDYTGEIFVMSEILKTTLEKALKVESVLDKLMHGMPTKEEVDRVESLEKLIVKREKELEEKKNILKKEQRSLAELRKKNDQLNEECKSLTKEKKGAEDDLAAYEESLKKYQKRAVLTWLYKEGDLEHGDRSGISISYLWNSLILEVKFGDEIPPNEIPSCYRTLPAYKLESISFKTFKNPASPLSKFAHKLILEAVPKNLLEMSPTTFELHKVLNKISLLTADTRELLQDYEKIDFTHRTKIKDKTILVKFVNEKAHVLFTLHFTISPGTYPQSLITPKFEPYFGKSDLKDQVLEVTSSIGPGPYYLRKIVAAVDKFLEELT